MFLFFVCFRIFVSQILPAVKYVEKNNITLEEIFLPKGFFDCILNEGKTTIDIPRGLEKNLNDYIKIVLLLLKS